jgi:hypothetical protein
MAKIEVSITGETEEFFKEFRDKREFKSLTEAVEYALPIAASRLKATMKYAKGHKPAPKPKKAKAPAKPKAPKAAKPKGPLARKTKGAKAPTVRKAKAESVATPAQAKAAELPPAPWPASSSALD